MKKLIFELDFPEGIVRFPYSHEQGPRLLWNIAYDVLPICDMLTEMGVAMAGSLGHSVSCKKGCVACCNQLVPLSPPEAAIIADVLENLPPDRKEIALSGFAQAKEKLSEAGLKETISTIYDSRTDKQTVLDTNKKYFDLAIPCPFLFGGTCGIYPHRPSRCREYSVLSLSECCRNPFGGNIKRLPLTIKLSEVFAFAWSALSGKPPIVIPLVNALEWVSDNGGVRTLCVEGAEHVAQAILESACAKANKAMNERMGSG
jgi:Fe-S-cluster containining protein